MSKHIGIVAKGIALDSVIDDMIKELAVATSSSEDIWQDYKFYRPCIINCAELYNYISLKFYTKESIMKNWYNFKNQYDDRAIHGFIDYCIVLFTNDPLMKTVAEIEQRFIYKKLYERIQKI